MLKNNVKKMLQIEDGVTFKFSKLYIGFPIGRLTYNILFRTSKSRKNTY